MKKENEIVDKIDNLTKDFDESLVCLKVDVDEKHHRVVVKGEASPIFIAECIHELLKNNPEIVKALDMMGYDKDEDENSSDDKESDSLDELTSTLKEVNSKLGKIMSKKTIH